MGLIPGWETKIPYVTAKKTNKKVNCLKKLESDEFWGFISFVINKMYFTVSF